MKVAGGQQHEYHNMFLLSLVKEVTPKPQNHKLEGYGTNGLMWKKSSNWEFTTPSSNLRVKLKDQYIIFADMMTQIGLGDLSWYYDGCANTTWGLYRNRNHGDNFKMPYENPWRFHSFSFMGFVKSGSGYKLQSTLWSGDHISGSYTSADLGTDNVGGYRREGSTGKVMFNKEIHKVIYEPPQP